MKHLFLAFTALFLAVIPSEASVIPSEASVIPSEAKESVFDTFFENSTLRLDYVFCGDNAHQAIYFQQALRTSEWAGRRENLSEPLLEGNGQIRVLDP